MAQGMGNSQACRCGGGFVGSILTNVSELMNQAAQAMPRAGFRGGNPSWMFTAEMLKQNESRTDIEIHLVTSIYSDSLMLQYRLQDTTITGEIISVEAR